MNIFYNNIKRAVISGIYDSSIFYSINYITGVFRRPCPVPNRSIRPSSFLIRCEVLRSIKVKFRDIVRDKFDVTHPSLIIKNRGRF